MDAMNARVEPGRQARGLSQPQQSPPYWRRLLYFWWVGILVLLVVVAVWVDRATSNVDVSASNRVAKGSPIATSAASATQVGASAPTVATPAVQDNSAWYLYQQTHEGDYCQCNK